MDVTGEFIEGIKALNTNGNITTNPMLLVPVIKCIYKYLGLKDIKNCRIANREWSLNSKQVLRDRSKIVLQNNFIEGRTDTISKFLEDFSDTPNNFNAFKLSGHFKLTEFNEFFESQQENLTELEFKQILLEDDEYNLIEKYNVSPLISRSPMTKPNTKYNTKLSLFCFIDFRKARTLGNLSVSLSALVSIKDISFTQVLVEFCHSEGLKMSPIKLKLNEVKFFNGEIEIDTICVNDIVDFSKCKSILLKSGLCGGTKISLDLNENDKTVSLDMLTLMHGVTVVNWANSSWKVNKVEMVKIPFLERSGMNITKLELSLSDIDFYCLPHSIESLTLNQMSRETVKCSYPISLPNLKYLYLQFRITSKFSFLSNFKNCPNLIDIHLKRPEGGWVV